jgi:hypothetical protein
MFSIDVYTSKWIQKKGLSGTSPARLREKDELVESK